MPTLRFMMMHPARLVALGFGSGLSPIAPGTVGTLWAWLAYSLWLQKLSDPAWVLLLVLSLLVGWWACTRTAAHMAVTDPGAIVWDEIIAFWLILWVATPTGAWEQWLLFGLFRYFDAAKPGPVAWADQVLKGAGWRGGLGIIFDDLVAAFCSLLVFALYRLW